MRAIFHVGAVLALCLGATLVVAAPHHGPADITIDAAADKREPVPFTHGQHATELVGSCDTCHHTSPGLTQETDQNVQSCSSCHLDPEDDAPSMREMSLRKNPFHVLCIDCHKEQDAGPVSCNDCHVK